MEEKENNMKFEIWNINKNKKVLIQFIINETAPLLVRGISLTLMHASPTGRSVKVRKIILKKEKGKRKKHFFLQRFVAVKENDLEI